MNYGWYWLLLWSSLKSSKQFDLWQPNKGNADRQTDRQTSITVCFWRHHLRRHNSCDGSIQFNFNFTATNMNWIIKWLCWHYLFNLLYDSWWYSNPFT
jgi:hypothetical protein